MDNPTEAIATLTAERDMTRPTTDELREMIAGCGKHPDFWVIPGDDNARMDGWIDARVTEEGEFSRPIHHFAPATIRAMAEEIIASRAELEAAVLAEREICAIIAATRHKHWMMPHPDDADHGEVCCDFSACQDIAAAIRARSTAPSEPAFKVVWTGGAPGVGAAEIVT